MYQSCYKFIFQQTILFSVAVFMLSNEYFEKDKQFSDSKNIFVRLWYRDHAKNDMKIKIMEANLTSDESFSPILTILINKIISAKEGWIELKIVVCKWVYYIKWDID